MLKEVVPEATRVVFLANPAYPVYPSAAKAMQAATASLGLQLRLVEVRHLQAPFVEELVRMASILTPALHLLPILDVSPLVITPHYSQ